MESPEGLRAAIYTRISSDQWGEALGVARQEADCRALCERRGWTVVGVFCDNDISAWSGKVRPAYRDILTAISGNEVDVVVAWHPDRLHRQTRELVAFIDLVEVHRVTVETVTAGTLDLSTPSGRMQAKIVGTVAEYESDHKAERIRRKLAANAAEGRHHGGSRPYGWKNDRITLDENEAKVVRDAAKRVLRGESVKAIARALNAAGYRSSIGREWRDVTVRDMLMRDRNAGIRMYHGKPVGRGRWAPILDEATLLQVKAVLTAPGRRTTPGRDGKVHMLSSIARCGVCDGPIIVARSKAYKGVTKPIYRCRDGHISRVQEDVDLHVAAVVVGRLSQPDARELLAAPSATGGAAKAIAEAELLRTRLSEAAEAYAAGVLTLAQLETVTRTLRPKITAAESMAADAGRVRVLDPLLTRDTEDAWLNLTPEQRRAVVDLLVTVTLHRSAVRGRYRNPETIEIQWKGAES